MTRFQRCLFWASSVATGVTGAAYWWMQNMMEPVSEWAVINHPLQPWVLKANIVVAPVLIFAVGLIAGQHIWNHFRTSIQTARRTGLVTMYVMGPLVISGYLIQVVTHSGWLAGVVWVHIGTGVLYLLGIAAHQRVLRAAKAEVSISPRPPALVANGVIRGRTAP